MSVQVTCQCGEIFLAPEKAGARVKCPHCGVKFALRELHEAGAGDLTPLPPDRDGRTHRQPAAGADPLAPAAPAAATTVRAPVNVLDDSVAARRRRPSDDASWLSAKSAVIVGALGAAALVIAALGYNAYLRDHAQPDSGAPSAEWPEFSSTEGRFAVRFPGNVETRDGSGPFMDGETTFESAQSVSADDTVLEIVSYRVDPPQGVAEREQLLEAYCDHLEQDFDLFIRRTIAHEGYAGREIAYEHRIDALSDIVRVQVYSAGSRFLKLTTRRIVNAPRSSDADKFFDSLRILNPPPGE